MPKQTFKTSGIAALLFCILIASCGTTSKMGVSPTLKTDATEYAVKGRNGVMVKQKLSFGPYATEYVKRSWVKGGHDVYGASTGTQGGEDFRNIISVDYIRKKQTVNFSLSDGSQQATAYCVARFNAEGLQLGANKGSVLNTGFKVWNWLNTQNLYYVQVYTANDTQPWELLLDNRKAQGSSRTYTGVFAKNTNEFYTVRPVTQIEQNGKTGQMPFGSVGYEILNQQGNAVAAVSRMEKGMVYLGNAPATEKLLMATLCTALLLQEHIE